MSGTAAVAVAVVGSHDGFMLILFPHTFISSQQITHTQQTPFQHRVITHLSANLMQPPMMTSSNGNIFRVTGPLCGEFTAQRPVTRSFDVFCASINGWVNNREAGGLRCHRAHYDVTVMYTPLMQPLFSAVTHAADRKLCQDPDDETGSPLTDTLQ